MNRHLLVSLVVSLTSSAACGAPLRSQAPTAHVASSPPPSTSPLTSASQPDLAVPSTLDLSAEEREALQTLGKVEAFGGVTVGYGGTPSAGLTALRVLLAEPHAADALGVVLARGTLPGQLMALAGLHQVDPEAYARHADHYRAMSAPVEVLRNGCIQGGNRHSASSLVSSIESGVDPLALRRARL